MPQTCRVARGCGSYDQRNRRLSALSHPTVPVWLEWMFRCEVCLLPIGPGIRAQRVVVETREKKYPIRPRANRVIRLSENGKPKESFADDPGGVGWEIVQERNVCPSCARRLSN
jgi:hypothetical protein